MDYYFLLIGIILGSFFNVLIDRLPKGQNVLWGRSHCDHCKKTLRWYELIPVISYIFQAGKCRRCHSGLSLQYPVMEIITGLGYFLIFSYYSYDLMALIGILILFSVFLVITVADIKYQVIPDSMLAVSVFGISMVHYSNFEPTQLMSYGLSAICSGGFFYALWYFTKGRGMGFGDVKLAFILGLTIDIFTSTLGIHTSATVFLAFSRKYILKLISPRGGYDFGTAPNLQSMGMSWFMTYAIILVLCHHLFLFYIESFTFSQFFSTFGRVILSSIFTLILIFIVQLFNYNPNARK